MKCRDSRVILPKKRHSYTYIYIYICCLFLLLAHLTVQCYATSIKYNSPTRSQLAKQIMLTYDELLMPVTFRLAWNYLNIEKEKEKNEREKTFSVASNFSFFLFFFFLSLMKDRGD